MARKYHIHTLQTNLLHREEETHSTNSPMTLKAIFKQPSLSLSLPQRDDCKTRNETKFCTTKTRTKYKKTQTIGATINNITNNDIYVHIDLERSAEVTRA